MAKTNVCTGDLAWWMVTTGEPWPVCEVGPRAIGAHLVKTTSGPLLIAPANEELVSWLCTFREPVQFGWYDRQGGIPIYAQQFPISDRFLKKITGPGMDKSVDTPEILHLDGPVDAPIFHNLTNETTE